MQGERKVGQDHGYYDWSPITKRAPLRWPDNARVALCVVLSLQHYDWQLPPEKPGGPPRPPNPDIAEFSTREYGNRIGVFRLLRILDSHGIKPTVAMDKMVADHYPYLAKECRERKLEVIAHGMSSRRPIHGKMAIEAEREYIRECLDSVAKAVGQRPRGWLGPGGEETSNTPTLLAAEGIRYVCDWSNDEQPYRMKVPQGDLFSMGVDQDLDDLEIHINRGRPIDDYRRMIQDAFDVLHADGAKNGRLMVITLHPWVSGQPWRSVYVDRALAHIAKQPGVWKASGQEIVDWYAAKS